MPAAFTIFRAMTVTTLIPSAVPEFMTADEFLSFRAEGVRIEWVDGRVITMAPVSNDHSDINSWLSAILRIYVDAKDLGILRGPEFAIRLSSVKTQRVPDLLFLAKARLNLLKPNCIDGPPDLIIEIVSPDSEARDWRKKYLEYESAGVSEYWVIDPMSLHLEAYHLTPQRQYIQIEEQEGKIASLAIPGFYLRSDGSGPPRARRSCLSSGELGIQS